MGTNYYLKYPDVVESECHCCGNKVDKQKTRHIGKSSGGWYFSLHVQPEDGLHNFEDWLREIISTTQVGGFVEDEYCGVVELHRLIDIVTARSGLNQRPIYPNMFYASEQEMLSRNNAEYGLNGLLKHIADGKHCIGHGNGTVSHIIGEFC